MSGPGARRRRLHDCASAVVLHVSEKLYVQLSCLAVSAYACSRCSRCVAGLVIRSHGSSAFRARQANSVQISVCSRCRCLLLLLLAVAALTLLCCLLIRSYEPSTLMRTRLAAQVRLP